jgi:hypothetical protein
MKFIELMFIFMLLGLVVVFILAGLDNVESHKSKENPAYALCQKHFNTDSVTVSIEKARTVYHKQDKPNTIIIKCEGK